MIEKGKISSFQMALMIVPTIVATAILTIPAITGKYAGRDMWISPILGSLNGFFTAFIVYQLHKLYPKESIIQYSRHIIGRTPGKVLGFVYLFFFLHICGTISRQYIDFIINAFLPKTPMIVVIGSMVLVCAFAVRGGVEVLGRSAQLFVPIFILLPLLLFILLIPQFKPENMFPIMEHGMMPSILGAAVPQSWFSEMFLISMLLPFLTDHKKGKKWSMISVVITMLVMVYTNIVNIFLFGESATSYIYPVFTAFRYISVATFFEHLEAFVITIWVMGIFIKLSVFYYALVLGTAQWLHLSDYRPLVFPLGFLVIIFGIWVTPSMYELTRFLGNIFPFYGTFIMTFIPVLLLLIAIIRKK
ncbi:endospore germination permease [Priestia megaterium]|nr:endospore germination permease [Priestia megaterium]MED3853119.1 endospore germination permease [Priestia megaterium]MED3975968.1 endospore germination permease [Priestia megaterium]MED4794918.1 endospore germination permease [Priestia megaterium]PEE75415.1 spore gernimation protein [Priestia megaterium]PFJ03062.1 spore gernimation protein [Priestia megaterium]